MFGYLIPRFLKGIDVRALSSDGNPGTANAFFYGGAFCGTLVLICELLKGFLPVYFAGRTLGQKGIGFALVMAGACSGTCFSGGKRKEKRRKGDSSFLWGSDGAASPCFYAVASDFLVSAVFGGYYSGSSQLSDSSYVSVLAAYQCFSKAGRSGSSGKSSDYRNYFEQAQRRFKSIEERKIRLGLGKK